MKTRKEKTRIHNLPHGPSKRGYFKRCLLYRFVDYSWKGTKSFDVLRGDQKLKVRAATYGTQIDQLQHAKSVSHIESKVLISPRL